MRNLNLRQLFLICLTIYLLGIVFIFGCERAEPVKPEPVATTLSSIQANIFNVSCALSGCHVGASPSSGLDLSEGKARGNIVNVPSQQVRTLARVKPIDPDNSYLVIKIEGAPGIVGERMPKGRPPLIPEKINAIREWIAAGAENN